MHRFFLPLENFTADIIPLPADTADQIRKVLRLKDGDTICLLDNVGKAFEAEIEYTDAKSICAHVKRSYTVLNEPGCRISMFLSLTQREKFEWMLQKCTEAGAFAIIPIYSERSLVRNGDDVIHKYPRWQKIIQEAAEQSERGIIPILHKPMKFSDAVQTGSTDTVRLFFWEEERQQTLQQVLQPMKAGLSAASIIIGPEGGFSRDEADLATSTGWISTTLGKRIYRVETAAIASVILTLYELDRQ